MVPGEKQHRKAINTVKLDYSVMTIWKYGKQDSKPAHLLQKICREWAGTDLKSWNEEWETSRGALVQHCGELKSAQIRHAYPLNLAVLLGLGCFFISSRRLASSSALRCWRETPVTSHQMNKKYNSNLIHVFQVCLYLVRLSLQVFGVAPVSPRVPHASLSSPLQAAVKQHQ